MWKVNSYVLPSKDYYNIVEEDVLKFEELLSAIKEKDNCMLPNEFYSMIDCNNVSASDFLFGNIDSDISILLMDLVTKLKHVNDTYDLIFQSINRKENIFLAVKEYETDQEISKYVILSKEEIPKVKRIFIKRSTNYEEFKKKAPECYNLLVFHADAFKNINRLGNIQSTIDELNNHLSILNDYGKEVYEQEKTEDKALDRLNSEFKITCSGKGSNESKIFKKDFCVLVNGMKKVYKLTCNAHTKFYNGNNNQRIYFCWGRDDIENHNIIIVHIGNHWK